MIKRLNYKVWVDSKGVTHNISKMSDDYVRNCIIFCQRRVQTLQEVNDAYNSTDMQIQITKWQRSVKELVNEMDRRGRERISIKRANGCEEFNRLMQSTTRPF